MSNHTLVVAYAQQCMQQSMQRLALHPSRVTVVQVPLEASKDAPRRQCICWEWTGPAADVGDEAAAWLSDYLGKPVRLVRYAGGSPASPRAVPCAHPTHA